MGNSRQSSRPSPMSSSSKPSPMASSSRPSPMAASSRPSPMGSSSRRPSPRSPMSPMSPMPFTGMETPVGPMNMNIFNDDGSPAWHSDIRIAPNPGVRAGPYAPAFMEHPTLTIPIRHPSPQRRRVTIIELLVNDMIPSLLSIPSSHVMMHFTIASNISRFSFFFFLFLLS
ncbi:hypothetical protein F4804DRAFT_115005 [Jackrogersella minutella]|nr:hypothetical protein F4804DRAFT_115005 [Jackrogersella minutella]